jgi:hypothetical protein
VSLTNLAAAIGATTVSTSTGAYQFLNVRVGTYLIEAELEGFTKAVVSDVEVTVNARQRVDLILRVGGIGEQVQVTGIARVLETESSDRGQVVAHEQIVSLPLNDRAYADLALLSPGVRSSSISTSRDASFNVNGMRSGTNQFHGTAWEFNRNTTLNATGFFKPTSGVKPKLDRNQFGGVFG